MALILVALMLLLTGGIATGAYLWSVGTRGRRIYDYLKSGQRGWLGQVHAAHPRLGFAPIPGSSGFHVFPVGPPIPMRYDELGCRVPMDQVAAAGTGPRILSLGGSFTYGDACAAEDTFTWQAGRLLNGEGINGGVCSWGLAEMLLRGRELIPLLKPDYVVIQWSHWLLSRAKRPFGPLEYGLLPTPYFYDTPDGPALHPPVFQTIVFDLPFDEFRTSPRSRKDFVRFILRAALPLFVHDDWNLLLFRVKSWLGILPEPSGDGSGIIRTVYGELGNLAREAGGEGLVLNLPWTPKPHNPPEGFAALGLKTINAQNPLLDALPAHRRKVNFRRMFTHYRGNPPHQVDKHPNPRAHLLIAEEIARNLAETEKSAKWR